MNNAHNVNNTSGRAEDRESKIQDACAAIKNGTHKTVKAAAREFDIPTSTLRRRVKGLTTSRKHAHKKERLLAAGQEDALCEWIAHLAATGHPISKRMIQPKVEALCGRIPSLGWIHRFIKRRPDIHLAKPTGLDPKRAQAFNPTTVKLHFQLLGECIWYNEIPFENIYNMDKKGIQLGGGRKGSQQKFFFSRQQKARHKIQSADLQLVTVIEVICADGTSDIKPGFVFSGTGMHDEWFCEPGTT
jgi:hypothetical protein